MAMLLVHVHWIILTSNLIESMVLNFHVPKIPEPFGLFCSCPQLALLLLLRKGSVWPWLFGPGVWCCHAWQVDAGWGPERETWLPTLNCQTCRGILATKHFVYHHHHRSSSIIINHRQSPITNHQPSIINHILFARFHHKLLWHWGGWLQLQIVCCKLPCWIPKEKQESREGDTPEEPKHNRRFDRAQLHGPDYEFHVYQRWSFGPCSWQG